MPLFSSKMKSPLRFSSFGFIFVPYFAFANCTDDAMLVFDASSSMAVDITEPGRITRIIEARQAIRNVLPQIEHFRRIGLIVLGPGETTGCSHVSLVLKPTPNSAGMIIDYIDSLMPDGATALTRSVQSAVEVLSEDGQPGTVVLITDGQEACGGQICAAASAIAAQEPKITIHVIGFRLRPSHQELNPSLFRNAPAINPASAECLAEQTGGTYTITLTVDELVQALFDTLGCELSS